MTASPSDERPSDEDRILQAIHRAADDVAEAFRAEPDPQGPTTPPSDEDVWGLLAAVKGGDRPLSADTAKFVRIRAWLHGFAERVIAVHQPTGLVHEDTALLDFLEDHGQDWEMPDHLAICKWQGYGADEFGSTVRGDTLRDVLRALMKSRAAVQSDPQGDTK